ncbi:hypothetical protein GGF32_006848, partial [Allomyces javanicus]
MAFALVRANPFRSLRDIPWAHPSDPERYLVSKATLIIAPPDRIQHWLLTMQLTAPRGAECADLTAPDWYNHYSWDAVLLADIVPITTTNLQSTAYRLFA